MIAKTSSTTRAVHKCISNVIHDTTSSFSTHAPAVHSIHLFPCKEIQARRSYNSLLRWQRHPPGVSADKDHSKPKRPLRSYDFSQRLVKLAEENELSDAVSMLQSAPADVCNVATWNTVIWLCLKASRYKLAYKLYIDMKRRGLRPNTRTYTSILDGLGRIDDFSRYSVQLENAHSVYDSFIKHIEAVKKVDPNHAEISTNAVSFYIRILGIAEEYNKMFDVFNSLDEDGPFSANEFTYSKMFAAIAGRRSLSPGDNESVSYRNASDARLLWKNMMTVYEKDPGVMTSHVVSGCLKALSRGRPTDQLFAFDVIRDVLGLAKPGETAPPPKIKLNVLSFDAILSLCLSMQKYRLCIHYYRQLISKPLKDGEQSIIDFGHMEKILQANAHMTIAGSLSESNQAVELIEWMHGQVVAGGQNAKQLHPRLHTYTWALMACWRGGDWASTTRILELMTGCRADDFLDQNQGKPLTTRTSGEWYIKPDGRSLSCVIRAALASGVLLNMRQCLRMLAFFGESAGESWMKEYLGREAPTWDSLKKNTAEYYNTKLLFTLKELLSKVLADVDMDNLTDEEKTWRALLQETKRIMRTTPRPNPAQQTTPTVEEEMLGSVSGLAATADFVEYDMAKRTTKSRTTRKLFRSP